MGNCLDAAIKYATKYGWAVFPCSQSTKKPLTPHGCLDAKKDVGAIRAWWKKHPDASIGVATGSMSNLIVIDEDIDENKDINGARSVRAWEKVNGEFSETVTAITGRGGYHLYFHYTGAEYKNRTGIIEGVDVRGEGGYVIAPPSIHPNGTEYTWEYDPDEIPVAEVDERVMKFLSIGKEDQGSTFKLPDRIPNGERNTVLFKLACSMQAQGIPDGAIAAAIKKSNDTLCDEPLPDSEIEVIVSSALRYSKGELKIIQSQEEWREPKITYVVNKGGEVTDKPVQSIKNAEEAIAYDSNLFGRIFYNELAYVPYVYGSLPWNQSKGWREWTNVDDSNLRSYIENKYGLKSSDKIMDALTNVSTRRVINPIKTLLEEAQELWDGNKHIENLLPDMLGAEKNDYTIAVMKLFMMGAIMRTYHPGCKFDYMLVLVGEQGGRKSSFLRFLALNDEWFNDNFSTLDSGRAVENLRGMWIVELAELQATKRAKDVETIKSFITSRTDTYRAPYNRRTEQRKRRCVLAGTSNPVDFLTDRTGNRRFLPITCNKSKATFDMFTDEIATKAIFMQAWGEAMNEFQQKGCNVRLVLPNRLETKAIEMQTSYMEENPKIGVIQEWLDKTEQPRVCALMLWREALHQLVAPDRKTVNELHEIMRNNITGWEFVGHQRVNDEYGTQRCYARKNGNFIDVIPDRIPFDA